MRASRWIGTLVGALSAVVGVGMPQATNAAPLTVCASGCEYTQIQPALDAAAAGATISVGPGTYNGAGLSITKNVSLTGTGMTATSIVGIGPLITVAPGATVTISDLTAIGGVNRIDSSAGGIANYGTLSLNTVTVTRANGPVGGIACGPGSRLTMTSVTIRDNIGIGSGGGGLYVSEGATVTGTGVSILGNFAGAGGGIWNNGTVSLVGATIAHNAATYTGGGVANYRGATLRLTDSTVTGNRVKTQESGSGGGIFNFLPGTVTLTNTTVTGNTPDDCVDCGPTAPGPSPAAVRAVPFATRGPGGHTAGFWVLYPSLPGQGYVLFGPGPGCLGLVEIATQDAGAGTTHHLVRVTGDDMNLSAGAVVPGMTYHFAVETVSSSGVDFNDNGGKCFSVTVPPT